VHACVDCTKHTITLTSSSVLLRVTSSAELDSVFSSYIHAQHKISLSTNTATLEPIQYGVTHQQVPIHKDTFSRGRVDPPRKTIVNNTITRVVVTT